MAFAVLMVHQREKEREREVQDTQGLGYTRDVFVVEGAK